MSPLRLFKEIFSGGINLTNAPIVLFAYKKYASIALIRK